MKIDRVKPDELVLVFDSWSRSFQKSPYAGCVRNCDWQKVMDGTMSEIVDRSLVLVGYQPLEDGTRRVMGYSISEPDKRVLHWLYMKDDWRGMGYGTELLKATESLAKDGPWTYTFRTRASQRFFGDALYRWDPVPARIKS